MTAHDDAVKAAVAATEIRAVAYDLTDVEHRRFVRDAVAAAAPILLADAEGQIADLTRWKAEASIVLGYWEAVWEQLGSPGALGETKSSAAMQAIVERDAEIDRLRAILNEHKRIAREGPFPHRKQYRGGRLNVLVHERDRAAAAERARILDLLNEIPHDPSCHDDIECDCPIAFMRHAIAKTAPQEGQ